MVSNFRCCKKVHGQDASDDKKMFAQGLCLYKVDADRFISICVLLRDNFKRCESAKILPTITAGVNGVVCCLYRGNDSLLDFISSGSFSPFYGRLHCGVTGALLFSTELFNPGGIRKL